jgi:hypothetical protein
MVALDMDWRCTAKVAFPIPKSQAGQWRIPALSERRKAPERHPKSASFTKDFRSDWRTGNGYNSLRPADRDERYAGKTLRGA